MHRSATAECQPAPDEIMPPSEMFRASPKRSESVKFVEFAAQSAMAATATITRTPESAPLRRCEQKPPFTTQAAFCTLRQCHLCFFPVCHLSKLEEMEGNIFPDMLPYCF